MDQCSLVRGWIYIKALKAYQVGNHQKWQCQGATVQQNGFSRQLQWFKLGFPTERDSATFRQRDRSSFIVSGRRDKLKILPFGRAGPGQTVKIRHGTGDRTITIFLSKPRMGHGTGNIFVPGQRNNRMFRPRLSRDVPQDIPSLGNPTSNHVSNKIHYLLLFRGYVT